MLKTEVLLQKYIKDLEELAMSQCPGTDMGRLGIGTKQKVTTLKE